MKLTDEQKEMVVNMGSMGFDSKKMAILLKIEKDVIDKNFNNKNSELSKLYDEGAAMVEYLMNLKLLVLAKSGDVNAINQILKT